MGLRWATEKEIEANAMMKSAAAAGELGERHCGDRDVHRAAIIVRLDLDLDLSVSLAPSSHGARARSCAESNCDSLAASCIPRSLFPARISDLSCRCEGAKSRRRFCPVTTCNHAPLADETLPEHPHIPQ